MAVTTGREVATGTLWISKSDSEKVRVRVAARCGTPDCTYQGQLNIYEESTLGGSGSISEPSRVISLVHISEVSSLNTSHPTFISGAGGSPPKGDSVLFPMNEEIYPTHEALWGFLLVLQTGEAVELFADTREQQQLWIKYLHLMSMFPFSPIPEEPRVNPIRESYRSKVKLSSFDADSVWPVYILSEEVGSRIQALGVHIVTLQSTLSAAKPARMTVISPLDNEPIVSWEANKMRRTGSLGNLVFIEIGRRCEGGPGLIWMYATPEDSLSFRETVTRFLFNGDARPVSTSQSQAVASSSKDPPYQYDHVNSTTTATVVTTSSVNSSPSSSGGSSFRLSYNLSVETPTKKKAEYDSAETDDPGVYDYAFNGPGGVSLPERSKTSYSSSPPPVNLYTHPSRNKTAAHKRSLSNPPGTPAQNKKPVSSDLSNAPLTKKYGGSNDSGVATSGSCHTLEDDFLEIDKSLSDILSDLSSSSGKPEQAIATAEAPTGLDDLIACLEELAKDEKSIKPPFKRSNTLPGNAPPYSHRRANSTSTCRPVHYLEHKKAKAELGMGGHNEYVMMKAASPLMKQKALQRLSYDMLELSPIKESSSQTGNGTSCNGVTEYENYPQPEDIANAASVDYKTPYANITTEGCSFDDDIYENNEPIAYPSSHDPVVKEKPVLDSLISSTLDELDNLQTVLDQIGK